MAERYSELTLVDIQNNQFTINNVFKDMTVGRFKRAVGIKARLPQPSWDNLQLHLGETELDDERALEFYNLDNESRIHFVSSSPKATVGSKKLAFGPQSAEDAAPTPPTVGPQPTFENVFIRSWDGRHYTFNHIPRNESVKTFRARAAEKMGWPADHASYVRLTYVKEMQDHFKLMDYDVQNNSTVDMVMRLPGGAAS